MKNLFLTALVLIAMICSSASSCDYNNGVANNKDNTEKNNAKINDMEDSKIIIKVNSRTFTATLSDNKSARAFKEMLPLTIKMVEMNRNEKYYDLPQSLPTSSSDHETIRNGDLMLFGSRTLVLFYKTISTSYSYTKLGKVDDATGLASALGSGNVTVTFEME